MYIQAEVSASKWTLFTSVYGFMRVAVANSGTLYLSENLMGDSQGSDAPRRTVETNLVFLEHLFYFAFGAVVQSYPDIIPPSTRALYSNVSHTLPLQPPPSLTQRFLQSRSAPLAWLQGTMSLAWKIAFRLCGSYMVTHAATFSLPSLPGVFRRHGSRSVVSPLTSAVLL